MPRLILGETFDIHGGGADLIFPHHENERAQSLCAFPDSGFARHWMHNGMLLVNGQKMSKSLGNFCTVQDMLEQAPGEAVRLLLLKTHYRSTLDFNYAALAEARRELDRFYRALEHTTTNETYPDKKYTDDYAAIIEALSDDLNTPKALNILHTLADKAFAGNQNAANGLREGGKILGLLTDDSANWFRGGMNSLNIEAAIAKRLIAKNKRDFKLADSIRMELEKIGVILEDGTNGTTWRKA